MQDKRFASLPLSREVLDNTPQEAIELLSLRQTCRLQGKQTYPYLVAAFASYLSGSNPAAFLSGGRESCRSVNPAYFLLSLLNSTYVLLRKQSWQRSARAAFCLFPGMATSGLYSRKERDAL